MGVVVLTGGPTLERGVKEFLWRLEKHPDISLLAVVCESTDPGCRGMLTDLWRRRRMLSVALLVQRFLRGLFHYATQPLHQLELNRTVKRLRDRIHYFDDIHCSQALSTVSECQPDLGLVYGAPVIRQSLFEIPSLGMLGIHHGKVPAYRGKKTTFWAIYNGEQTVGVTIQRINRTLDGGDVVEAGEIMVGRRLPPLIWRDLEALGLDLYIKAILEVADGTASYKQQNGDPGKLYKDPKVADILVYWLRYTRRLMGGIT
jgi:methionyl-tRNA formyltransferase